MSKVSELEEKLSQAKRQVLKDKYLLEDELEQLKQDKFSYKRKGDFSALEKANIKEKELKSKLNTLKNRIPSLEAQLKKAKEEELRQKARVETKRKQVEKQNTTKKQMNSILRLMRQGKTRSQAAQSVGVPLSRVSHWVREGKNGVTTYSHFYHEVTSIEEDRERRKQQEINRQNRIREQERQRKLQEEREKRERERKLREQKQKQEKDNIKKQMDSIVGEMRKGRSRIQAAINVGVSSREVNEWFNNGRMKKEEPYKSFYTKVNTIETQKRNDKKQETPKSKNMIKCPKCGKWYSEDKKKCPHCKDKSTAIAKVNYCQNCGKKLSNNELNYCSKCGASIKSGKKVHAKKTTVKSTPSNESSDDLIKCCLAVFAIFLIIGFIMAIL